MPGSGVVAVEVVHGGEEVVLGHGPVHGHGVGHLHGGLDVKARTGGEHAAEHGDVGGFDALAQQAEGILFRRLA